MKKNKLKKIVGRLSYKLRKLYMNGTLIAILGNICFSEQIFFSENSRWVPLNPTEEEKKCCVIMSCYFISLSRIFFFVC